MLASLVMLSSSTAQSVENRADEVLRSWYKVALELVRHTPTYSPPVASRSFAYLGVVAFEATASGQSGLKSLAGQLNGLQDLPARETGETYDEAVVLEAAMANLTHEPPQACRKMLSFAAQNTERQLLPM
jgi:hypothetical protein